jgi:hypothetical protein
MLNCNQFIYQLVFFFFFMIINERFHGNLSGPRTVCDSSNLINLGACC